MPRRCCDKSELFKDPPPKVHQYDPIMTYKEYYTKLVKDIAESETNISKQNETLKGEKGYMDHKEMHAHMSLRNDFNSLLSRFGEISKLITSGEVNPHDEVDASRFPYA